MKIHNLFLISILCFTLQQGIAQPRVYELKKGQAFDILLFNTLPETKETLDQYFSAAIPVAQAYGYKPQRGFKVKQRPTQGNYWPKTVIIGLWDDYDKREDFTHEIVQEVPDFHEMRRTIWSSFFLTYWEVQADQTIRIDSDKFNVMTSYWGDSEAEFTAFIEDWKQLVKDTGGTIDLQLTKGSSPVGYHYNPDHLTIASWESQEAFEQFNEKNQQMNHAGVQHVNQFIIE